MIDPDRGLHGSTMSTETKSVQDAYYKIIDNLIYIIIWIKLVSGL